MKITNFEDDLLELKYFSKRLEKFIDTEHHFIEGSLVVALSSKFGSGKSTFLRMWRSAIESDEDGDDKPIVIFLNAWESDYNGDPLFAIVSALVEVLQDKGEEAGDLLQAAKDFGWFATAIGSQMVNKLTGIDPVMAGEAAKKARDGRVDKPQMEMDAFTVYEGRKRAMLSLKEAIRGIVASSTPKVLFLVDELDRCRPDYAITYLETIKHIFDIQGAVFVLAADREQLENSAKSAFGPDLDFEEYYRKFVHREIMLPEISRDSYRKLAKKYVEFYLERDGYRLCFMGLDEHRVENISELIGALGLTPRQIQEVFRVMGHMFDTSEENRGRLLWCIAVGSIAMATFKIGAPKIFDKLGREELDPAEAMQFLKYTIRDPYPNWWFSLFLTGGGLRKEEGETNEDVFKRVGLIDENEVMPRGGLDQWHSGWGHHRLNRFRQIYEKIQHISQWD